MSFPLLCLELCGEVDEVLQPAPGRLRAFVGGAWQRVQGIFRRSSSSGGGTVDDDEEPAVEAIVAENPESQAATLPGDFRILPASVWPRALLRDKDRAGDVGIQHSSYRCRL